MNTLHTWWQQLTWSEACAVVIVCWLVLSLLAAPLMGRFAGFNDYR